MNTPKVALIHDYLTQYGGAERVLEALSEIYPDAPIYTGVYNTKKQTKFHTHRMTSFATLLLANARKMTLPTLLLANARKIITPGKNINETILKFPALSKYLTFLMPLAFENFNLDEFDIIISDSSSYSKGVLTKPNQLHISYIHTPPRFLYGYSVESTKRNAWYYKPVVSYVDHYLRIWDFCAAQRPDFLIANSRETQKRIQKFYKRDATIIYPPVDSSSSKPSMSAPYYLAVGRMAAYKNFDFLIEAFNLTGMPLFILGTGPEEKRLKKLAKPGIKFLGEIGDAEKQHIYTNCTGIIFPVVDEDFGIVPVEAKSFGKPVLAHRSGGVLETIREGIDGMFFDELNIDHFVKKLKEFDSNIRTKVYSPNMIKEDVQRFSKDRFKEEIRAFVHEKWEEHNAGTAGSSNNYVGS